MGRGGRLVRGGQRGWAIPPTPSTGSTFSRALAGSRSSTRASPSSTLATPLRSTKTGLAPRLYIDPGEMLVGILQRSATSTHCPYKGTASYWSLHLGADVVADIAKSYDDPIAEAVGITGAGRSSRRVTLLASKLISIGFLSEQ